MSVVFTIALLTLVGAILVAARSPRFSALGSFAGAALLTLVGFASAGGWSLARIDLGTWLGFGEASLRIDRLSGIFLTLVGFTAATVSLAHATRPPSRFVAAVHAVLLFALAAVIAADQGFVFLLAWEVVTVSLFLLAGADRDHPGALVAAYFTGAVSKIGGAALLVAFGLLYARTGSFAFADWAHAAPSLGSGTRTAVFLLFLAGFGTKIGLLPFQGPLPLGYAAAPGVAAATISVALNVGFYGIWRLIVEGLAPAELWWGQLLLVLGGLGALVGILYAVGQEEIKRFLGFSSVEHGGIVLMGLGVALIGQASGKPALAAVGLLAATLHVVMHGLAKTLAFLAAARLTDATGGDEMEPLGGLAAKLPRTALTFGVAVLNLAAIPPLAGFVSEWFTLEALLQGFRLESSVSRLLMALAAAALALTAGIALLAFAKLYGTVFLGRMRTSLDWVREPAGMDIGIAALGTIALVLGAFSPWEIRWLGRGLEGVLGFDASATTISHPLVLGPVFKEFSVLSPTWLALALPGFALTVAAIVRLALRPAVRTAPIWASGTLVPPAEYQYTPAGYSNPIRVVLRPFFGFSRTLRPTQGGQSRLETRVIPAFEHYLYEPLTAGALWLSARARRLQSGSLGLYLFYLLAVLLVVLALIPALSDK